MRTWRNTWRYTSTTWPPTCPTTPSTTTISKRSSGRIHSLPSRIKKRILNNNKIERRYYAIDPATGALTHTNAQLTALAIRGLNPYPGFTPEAIQCLCCGTTTPDLIAPGHGLMVHGELGNPPCEVISTAGICLSGIAALKYAYMNVALELSDNAVATGSELASSLIRANFFEHLKGDPERGNSPVLAFESDFLRWMISDAAGAVFLSRNINRGPTEPAGGLDRPHLLREPPRDVHVRRGGEERGRLRDRLAAFGQPPGGAGQELSFRSNRTRGFSTRRSSRWRSTGPWRR